MIQRDTFHVPDLGLCKVSGSGGNICIQNQKQRHTIRKMKTRHGRAFLGIINRYQGDRRPWLREYMRGIVLNYDAGFVVPCRDDVLVSLLRRRHKAAYTGTSEDFDRVLAIFDRIAELGGVVLTWR